MTALAARESARAWELRTAWALGREVLLVLEPPAEVDRARGFVEHVAPSDAFVVLSDAETRDRLHVPLYCVLTVARPDAGREKRRGRPVELKPGTPGQTEIAPS